MHPAERILDGRSFVAFDIGAARGLLPHWRPLAKWAHLYLFEPDADAIPQIRKTLADLGATNAKVLQIALSKTGGPQTLHVLAAHSSASLLRLRLPDALDYADEKYVFPIRDVTIETRRLGDVLMEESVDRVDLAKLDTQGTELDILHGADDRLDTISGVELEVGIPGNYEAQATLPDVLSYLGSHGLEPFQLSPQSYPLVKKGEPQFYERTFGAHRNSPTLGRKILEVDAVFFRTPASALQRQDSDAVRRLVVAYALYGFFAHAHRLVERARESEHLDAAADRECRSALVDWHARIYKRRVALDIARRILDKAAERFSPFR